MARNAVDASTPVTAKAAQLSAAGVTSIGRYYNYGAGPKVLTRQEASALIKEGISIWVVFQFRNNEAGYFSASVGRQDALRALECAHQIVGQPEGTAIYFGVDYDETGHAYGGSIAPYFKAVRDTFERQDGTMPYQIGVYGNGLVCRKLLEDGLVTKTWLSC